MDDVTFRRVRHVVTEDQRVLDTVATLRAPARGDRAAAGCLARVHARRLEISVPELDLAVDTARAAGAIGARMTGGGFGGAAIALIDHSLVASVTAAVERAFADAGTTRTSSPCTRRRARGATSTPGRRLEGSTIRIPGGCLRTAPAARERRPNARTTLARRCGP
jgi:galactokinase